MYVPTRKAELDRLLRQALASARARDAAAIRATVERRVA